MIYLYDNTVTLKLFNYQRQHCDWGITLWIISINGPGAINAVKDAGRNRADGISDEAMEDRRLLIGSIA